MKQPDPTTPKRKPEGGDVFARMQSAAHDADTSPYNPRQPTAKQLQENRYKTGDFVLHGMVINIETPYAAARSGVSDDGKEWRNLLTSHYGDIAGTKGADGDPIDVFVGPLPETKTIWVINQKNPNTERFDEHKVMLGFSSEDHAKSAYTDAYDPHWNGLQNIVKTSIDQFKRWLKFGDKSRPFPVETTPFESKSTMEKVFWNDRAEPLSAPLPTILYQLRTEDSGHGLMLDAVTMDELMADPDIEAVPVFDAMVAQVGLMQPKMEALQRIMASAGETVKPTEMTLSDPVRYKGAAQVMALFTMSDGQTVAIWFHNPDTTPAKLMPLDMMTSWKWMLNKKDVTIVVAPEKGKDLNAREVARRIMKLVEKNSAAFTKANAKVAEKAAQLQALDDEIAGLETELKDVQRQIELVKIERETVPVVPAEAAAGLDMFGEAPAIPMDFSDLLKSGRLSDAIEMLAGFPFDKAQEVLLKAGFGLSSIKRRTTDALIEDVQLQLVKATQARTDGWGLRKDEKPLFGAETPASPTALERAYAIAGILMTKFDWAKADESGRPETGIVVDSPRGTMNWVKLGDAGGTLSLVASLTMKNLPSADESNEAIAAALDAEDARAAEPVAPVAPTEPAAPAQHPVDAVYKFNKATEAFKNSLIGSLDSDSYSPFYTSKSIDEAVKRNGGTIAWDLTTVFDSVSEADEDDDEDWDAESEFDVWDGEDEDGAVFDGDFKGHPFRGNQYKKASRESGTAVGSSMRAKHAEKHGDKKAQKKAHKAAYYANMAAAQDAKGKAKSYHRKMAKFHAKRGGVTLDSVFDSIASGEAHTVVSLFDGVAMSARAEVVDVPMFQRPFGAKQVAFVDWGTKSAILVDVTPAERAEFGPGVFRTGKGELPMQTLVKLDPKGMKVYMLDEAAYAEDGVAQWGQPVKLKKLMVHDLAKFTAAFRAKVLDGVTVFDEVEGYEEIVGVIKKGARIVGRAHVGGDGKAMVFLGKKGKDRVKIQSFRNDGELITPMWSDDDAGYLVDALFTVPENGVAKVAPVAPAPAAPVRSTQFLSYMAAINDGKASPGMLEQIRTDARLEDGESEILVAEAQRVMPAPAAPVVVAEPEPVDPVATPADNDLKRLDVLMKKAPKEGEAVRSDDPNAIEKLGAKLDYLIAYGDMMRKANKLVRKKDRAGLAAMGFSGRTLESLFEKDFAGRIGFADYMMTNNNGVIRTTRLRLEELEAAERARYAQAPEPSPEPAPAPQPTPAMNPQKAADTAYLNSLINGTGDLLASDTFDKLEPMFTTYEADAEMMAMLEQAAQAYGDAAVEAAKQALAA